MKRVVVFDYGAGNLHSLVRALQRGPSPVEVTVDLSTLTASEVLVLPGVGAFSPAAERLHPFRDRIGAATRDGLGVLGICLGMQLLFERSEEGPGEGLGIFDGAVVRLKTARAPHMGWNLVEPAAPEWAYFAHSFVCAPEDPGVVAAWTTHEGLRFPAIVRRGRVLGMQFHPEKSGAAGVATLTARLEELAS